VEEFWHKLLGDKFLAVKRLSRIYYRRRFFNYPLKPMNALLGLGLWNSFAVLCSYGWQRLFPYRREDTFEQWVSNRFGKKLYNVFFKTYTEKVWGVSCSELSAEWAAQRIKGMNLVSVAKTALGLGGGKSIKSLIEEFKYPEHGPGQLYEIAQGLIESRGHQVCLNSCVERIEHDGAGRIVAVRATSENGPRRDEASCVLSSIPLDELVLKMDPPAPADVQDAARQLKYRDFLVVNLILRREDLFPDNWIYVHDADVRVGRIQNYKNWSASMVADAGKTAVGMEYFCNRGDETWEMKDEDLIARAAGEIETLGLAKASDLEDGLVVRRANAYCLHDTGYHGPLETVKSYIAGFSNLQPIGRAGMFRYNNQDHAIMTGFLAARNILGGAYDIWSVNVDAEYLEER
jgi:protoporphyrinogen oxidase